MNESTKTITRYRCSYCGKMSVGRLGADSFNTRDKTTKFPRRHMYKGIYCPGNSVQAEQVIIQDNKPDFN